MNEPSFDELEAGQQVIDALGDGKAFEVFETERERQLVAQYLRNLEGVQKFNFLNAAPQFMWAINILENHGFEDLEREVLKYTERNTQYGELP